MLGRLARRIRAALDPGRAADRAALEARVEPVARAICLAGCYKRHGPAPFCPGGGACQDWQAEIGAARRALGLPDTRR